MKDLFEGKIISVVGNSASLIQQSFGKEIDQSQVVVRINRGGYRFVDFPKQMGMKLDVWCMQNIKQNRMFFDKPHTRKVFKMQMDTRDISPDFIELANEIFSNEDKNDLDSNLSKKSSTGLRVLYYIKKQNPQKVFVYGFDWKKTYSWHERRKCVAHNFEEEHSYCMKNIFDSDKFVLRGFK